MINTGHCHSKVVAAASTQNQAPSALLSLYREVLCEDLDLPFELMWAKRTKRLPTVLAKDVQQLITQLTMVHHLIVRLQGNGLRLVKYMRLQVKDSNSRYRQILVPDAKGGEGQVTILPSSLVKPLRVRLARADAE